MPGIPSFAGAWILERLELQPLWRKTGVAAVSEQSLSIGRDEVRHWAALPGVSVQPEPAAHGVDHSFAA